MKRFLVASGKWRVASGEMFVMMCLVCLLYLAFVSPLMARGPQPKPFPRLILKDDIQILDEQYYRDDRHGATQGWSWPADFHASMGARMIYANEGGGILGDTQYGRFGLISGRLLYSTWRPIYALSNEDYAEGKKTIYSKHVSNLISPAFEIKLAYITFLISGGYAPGKASINLLVDPSSSGDFDVTRAQVVRSATGRNDDRVEWVAFDIRDLKGKKAQIQVLDTSTEPFGYVTVDCVCQSPGTKNAVRVITTASDIKKSGVSRIETLAGTHSGKVILKAGGLLMDGKPVDLKTLLSWTTGMKVADGLGKRVELVDGSALAGEIRGLEEGKLIIDNSLLGEQRIPLKNVAQAIFNPGPSVKAKPGTLIHANGNKIPGELTWIRKDTISIKCALGQLPLPRGRVQAFVFAAAKPEIATETTVLTDGSKLHGTLTFTKDGLVLTNATIGQVKLKITDVVQVTRRVPGVTSLVVLKSEIKERVGAITPPPPAWLKTAGGDVLRLFPRTIVGYKLPKSNVSRRFRGTLRPVANCRIPVTAGIRFGNTNKTYTVKPGSPAIDVDLDLGVCEKFELIAETPSVVAYPSGIEWHNAFIIEDKK